MRLEDNLYFEDEKISKMKIVAETGKSLVKVTGLAGLHAVDATYKILRIPSSVVAEIYDKPLTPLSLPDYLDKKNVGNNACLALSMAKAMAGIAGVVAGGIAFNYLSDSELYSPLVLFFPFKAWGLDFAYLTIKETVKGVYKGVKKLKDNVVEKLKRPYMEKKYKRERELEAISNEKRMREITEKLFALIDEKLPKHNINTQLNQPRGIPSGMKDIGGISSQGPR